MEKKYCFLLKNDHLLPLQINFLVHVEVLFLFHYSFRMVSPPSQPCHQEMSISLFPTLYSISLK